MWYRVKAINQSGTVSQLEIEAGNASEAGARVSAQGYRVLSLTRAHSLAAGAKWQGKFSLLTFSQELLALLDAGLGLIEALTALARKERRETDRAMLDDILTTLRHGESYSAALSRFPGQFPPIYVAAVHASERTSNLKEALTRYIAYAEQYDRARKQIASALIYPAIVVLVGLLVIAFLLLYVGELWVGDKSEGFGSADNADVPVVAERLQVRIT